MIKVKTRSGNTILIKEVERDGYKVLCYRLARKPLAMG